MSPTPFRVAVVDERDPQAIAERFDPGTDVYLFRSDEVASRRFERNQFDCLICTDTLGEQTPTEVVETIGERRPDVPVVAAPRDGSERLATQLLGKGACDYVPLDDPALVERVREAVTPAEAPGEKYQDVTGEAPGPSTDVARAVTDDAIPVPLDAVAGSLSEVLVTIDADSSIRYVNDAVQNVFGYDPDEIRGQSLTTLMPDRFHDAHHAGIGSYLQTGERSLDWSSIELPGERADGDEIDLEISFGEFSVDAERYFTGLIRDVSPLVERETALSDLYAAAERLLLATDPESIAEIAVETAAEALDLPISGVYRHDPAREALVPVATTEQAKRLFGEPMLEAGESLAWETFQRGETRVIEDVPGQEDVHNSSTEIRTELQVPIGDRWILLTGTTEGRRFEDYQVDFAQLLATSAAAAFRRTRREAALHRYESAFRTIDEQVCVLDSDGQFRMVNDALCSFLGYTEAELRGTPAARFASEADVQRVRSGLGALDAGESLTFEIEVDTESGPTPCEIVFSALPEATRINGVVAAVHDISDRKRVESELQHQRDRFVELFENVPDPVVEAQITDGTPIVQSVNTAFEEAFGYDESVVVGESLNDFVLPPAGGERPHELDREAGKGNLVTAEVKRETADGIRDFLFRGIPVSVEDDMTLAFGVYTDITDQRLRQRRLSVLNRVLRHNIRNDMNVVIGRAEYLDTAPNPDVSEHAQAIYRTATAVVDLAEGVRSAERALERDEAPTRPLDTVLRHALEPFRDRSDVDISILYPNSQPPDIDERVEIVIERLVESVIEHAESNRTTIEIVVEHVADTLRLQVRDDGSVLPPTERAVLEGKPGTQLEHGRGIALRIVSWLIRTLGGEISVDKADTKGTVIDLAFPASALAWSEPE